MAPKLTPPSGQKAPLHTGRFYGSSARPSLVIKSGKSIGDCLTACLKTDHKNVSPYGFDGRYISDLYKLEMET